MAFTTRRGRPPASHREKNDLGTPELRKKRVQKQTIEPLDLCLEKGIISELHHWCGIHLRWLYTLRYGAPSVSSRDISDVSHGTIRLDDPEWRALREHEYHEAVHLLHKFKNYTHVMNLAVYHELPAFLNASLVQKSLEYKAIRDRLNQIKEETISGFTSLEHLWCTPKKKALNHDTQTTSGHIYEPTSKEMRFTL